MSVKICNDFCPPWRATLLRGTRLGLRTIRDSELPERPRDSATWSNPRQMNSTVLAVHSHHPGPPEEVHLGLLSANFLTSDGALESLGPNHPESTSCIPSSSTGCVVAFRCGVQIPGSFSQQMATGRLESTSVPDLCLNGLRE